MEQAAIQSLLPSMAQDPAFAPESRLWIYIAERALNEQEKNQVESELLRFTDGWTAHNAALMATAELWNNQVIMLLVDETQAGASGCSIDKSVRFLEQLGEQLNIDFFDRMQFAWINQAGAVQFNKLNEIPGLLKAMEIQGDTIVVNTLVKTLGELRQGWLSTFETSWQSKFA